MTTLKKEIQDVLNNTSNILYKEEVYINDKHEYDYHKIEAIKESTIHTLYYSDDFEWAVDIRKTIAMQLIDTGNGIKIIGIKSNKEINYLKAEQIHILLRLSSEYSVYKIAEPSPKRDF